MGAATIAFPSSLFFFDKFAHHYFEFFEVDHAIAVEVDLFNYLAPYCFVF